MDLTLVFDDQGKKIKRKRNISETLYNIASDNVDKDYLRRWWCKKYNLPPTDKRLAVYTLEELAIEFIEDAIDEGLIVSVGDKSVATVDTRGMSDAAKAKIQAFEERWENQKTIDQYIQEMKESDVLAEIEAEVDGSSRD